MILHAITGHTSGIGLAIYNRLSPSIIGFSKSTGYDITKKYDRSRIISESQHCSVFINNATDGFGQVELLMELFESWKDSNKTIINVGSRIAEITLSPAYINLLSYAAQKKALKSIIPDMQHHKCKVEYKWFGYVGTEKILKKYPHFTPKDYISVNDAIDIILGNNYSIDTNSED
jgi:hypothetical protein